MHARTHTLKYFVPSQMVQETLEGELDLMLEIIINSLLTRLSDSSPIVRKLCLQGLSNIVYAPNHQVRGERSLA